MYVAWLLAAVATTNNRPLTAGVRVVKRALVLGLHGASMHNAQIRTTHNQVIVITLIPHARRRRCHTRPHAQILTPPHISRAHRLFGDGILLRWLRSVCSNRGHGLNCPGFTGRVYDRRRHGYRDAVALYGYEGRALGGGVGVQMRMWMSQGCCGHEGPFACRRHLLTR
jgi:hypothetical protein